MSRTALTVGALIAAFFGILAIHLADHPAATPEDAAIFHVFGLVWITLGFIFLVIRPKETK